MRKFDDGGPMTQEEEVTCELVADAIIDLAILAAKRMHVSPYSRVVAFFQVASLGAWEKSTLERFWERCEEDQAAGNKWDPLLPS